MDEVQFVSAVARVIQPPHLVINLKAEVEAAVKPYINSTALPPFSVAEIMVMAWVCRKYQSELTISDKKVSDWMVMNFGFYRKMALKELYSHSFQVCATTYRERHTFHDIAYNRLLQAERLEFPLQASLPADTSRPTHRTYSSTPASSRMFLRRVLGNEMSNFDRLLELPAEVRLMIYEEVLRVPTEELQYDDHEFDPKNKNNQLRLSSRGERHELSYYANWANCLAMGRAESTLDYKPSRWATEPTSELMALLRVNRQIFGEAMPVFYNVNSFHANTLQDLTHMLQHCGARRRACFNNISFDYGEKTGPRTAIKAFRLLMEVKYLHSLQISIEDKPYLEAGPDAPLYKSADQMPGLELLGIIRVRGLEFLRACPKVESYLRPRMLMKEDEAEKIRAKVAKRFRKSVKKVSNP